RRLHVGLNCPPWLVVSALRRRLAWFTPLNAGPWEDGSRTVFPGRPANVILGSTASIILVRRFSGNPRPGDCSTFREYVSMPIWGKAGSPSDGKAVQALRNTRNRRGDCAWTEFHQHHFGAALQPGRRPPSLRSAG